MSASNLKKFVEENRVIRGQWVGTDKEGRETACLLAAISPEVREKKSPEYCPASLMPAWLAHLTPFIDDRGTSEHWPVVIRRYADLADRWHVLNPEAWERAHYKTKRIALVEAMSHTQDEGVLKICGTVKTLLDRAIVSDFPTPEEWAEAEAEAASEAAAKWAASAAKWAASEAKWAAAAAAKWAAAAAAKWAASEAKWAADRMIDAILDVLEEEILKLEKVA